MSDLIPASPFDAIRRMDEHGEHWSARDLMAPMGYGRWNEFRPAIDRAISSATNQGHCADDLFRVNPEKTNGRPREDFRLTRFAAYLVAMNGDPRKAEVAASQSYFAIRTREAEVAAEPHLDEIEVARRWVAALEREKELESENAKLRVKADQFDDWLNGKGCYLIGTVAKMLGLRPNALFDFLYAEKILIRSPGNKRHREPYSRPDTAGWFDIKAVPPERANGHATRTTYLTPYGAEQVRLRLIKRGLLPHEQLALISGGL